MRPEKQLLLDEIKEKMDVSKAFILTSYQKMEANTSSKFRDALDKKGGSFEVVRKRILLKALESAGMSINLQDLKGHVGVVFVDKDAADMTDSIKEIYQFSEANSDALTVLSGHIEGKLYPAKDVEKLSKLPAMPQMRAEFLGTLEAPMAQTLAVIEALLTSVLHCLENKATEGSPN
jgi:large subunit ribosomal protein L10